MVLQPQEAARIRAEALALEEEQQQQRREQRALAAWDFVWEKVVVKLKKQQGEEVPRLIENHILVVVLFFVVFCVVCLRFWGSWDLREKHENMVWRNRWACGWRCRKIADDRSWSIFRRVFWCLCSKHPPTAPISACAEVTHRSSPCFFCTKELLNGLMDSVLVVFKLCRCLFGISVYLLMKFVDSGSILKLIHLATESKTWCWKLWQ